MKKNLVAYLPMRDAQVEIMFNKKGWVTTNDPKVMADAVVFTGGADVTPFLYGEHTMRGTNTNPARDMSEVRLFKSLPPQTPKIGICRGAQFLNVMCGGRMWQDVNNHCGSHDIIDFMTGHIIRVTSTHHQMMIPGHLALEVAGACRSTMKQGPYGKYNYQVPANPQKKNDYQDTEVLYYADHEALCFQPHPEYDGHPGCTEYFWMCVQDFLFPNSKEEVKVG